MVMTKPLSLFRTKPAAPADGPSLVVPNMALAAASIDLLPIPAALVTHIDDIYDLVACNTAFQHAGLGVCSGQSPMLAQVGDRIAAFLVRGLDGDPPAAFKALFQERRQAVLQLRFRQVIEKNVCQDLLRSQTPWRGQSS